MKMTAENAMAVAKLRSIQPGQSFVYWTGDSISRTAKEFREAFYNAAEKEHVHLTQRRLGPPITGKTKDGPIIDWRNGIGPGFEWIATARTWRTPKKHHRLPRELAPCH